MPILRLKHQKLFKMKIEDCSGPRPPLLKLQLGQQDRDPHRGGRTKDNCKVSLTECQERPTNTTIWQTSLFFLFCIFHANMLVFLCQVFVNSGNHVRCVWLSSGENLHGFLCIFMLEDYVLVILSN